MKLAIAAIVKDEIDSLMEWIAYHRVVGADYFLVADNGSQDGTRELLRSLSEMGDWLQTVDVTTPPDRAPQLIAYEQLAERCPEDVDLIAFIDADEYILPIPGNGNGNGDGEAEDNPRQRLHTWLDARFADEAVSAVTMNWACFGSNGHRFRKDGLVIERFQQRAKQGFGPNHHYKSIVRRSALVRMLNPHHPELKYGVMRNADGRSFDYRLSREGEPRKGLSEEIAWQEVRLNHYLVKSVEEFVLKKARRGSAATIGYNKNAAYFENHDRNDETCTIAAELAPSVREEFERLETLIEVERRLTQKRPGSVKRDRSIFTRKRDDASPVRQFVIDYPQAQGEARVEAGQVLIQGWLFLEDDFADLNASARLIVRWVPEFELCHALSKKRPDVVAHFGYEAPAEHPQLHCGFQFFLPLGVDRCELELEIGQQRWPLKTLKINTSMKAPQDADKVYKRRDGWLFLRADTNLSYEQHLGNLLLTTLGLERWKTYFDTIKQIADARRIQSRVLITPSKEAVLEAAYGLPRAKLTAVDQVLRLAPTETLYPLSTLRALGDEAFYRTDTHWTHQAAMKAAVELAILLGLKRNAVEAVFNGDTYREVDQKGDLGGKLVPPVRQPVKVLKSFSNTQLKVYDNAIPNFGRLVVFKNNTPLDPGVLLLCGASSSTGLFNYLSRIYGCVVFVHTAGNLDTSLINEFAPDYVIMQTTARFAIRPPTCDFSFEHSLKEKIASLSAKDIERIDEKRVTSAKDLMDDAIASQNWRRFDDLYHTLLERRRLSIAK